MTTELHPTERLRRGETYMRTTGRGFCMVAMVDAGGPAEKLVLSFQPFKRCRWAYRSFTRHFPPHMLGCVMGYVTRTVGKPPTMREEWVSPSSGGVGP
jgi:hypothetical protein